MRHLLAICTLIGAALLGKGLYSHYTSVLNARAPAEFTRLSVVDQKLLVNAVLKHCITDYERDSCLHYLITCGPPCTKLLGPQSRKRVRADYEALLKERGLPSMDSQRVIGAEPGDR